MSRPARKFECARCGYVRFTAAGANVCEACAHDGVVAALAAYDAAPRMESKYRPAFDRLREACEDAGMGRYHNAVVDWARTFLL